MLVSLLLACAPKAPPAASVGPAPVFTFGWTDGDRARAVHLVRFVADPPVLGEALEAERRAAVEVRADGPDALLVDHLWLGPVDAIARALDPYRVGRDGRFLALADPDLSFGEFQLGAPRATAADQPEVVAFLEAASSARWQGIVGLLVGARTAPHTASVSRTMTIGLLPMRTVELPATLTVGPARPCVADGPPECVEVTIHTVDDAIALAAARAEFPQPVEHYRVEQLERLVVRPSDLRPFELRSTARESVAIVDRDGTSKRIDTTGEEVTCWSWGAGEDPPDPTCALSDATEPAPWP